MVNRDWRRQLVSLAVGICLAGFLPERTFAQGAGGQIEGTVRDQQSAVLPGATVTLRNEQTGVTRVAVTETDGRYLFPALAPGVYSVKVELQGFATTETKNITITIGLSLTDDFSMKLQSVSETVTVAGTAPVIDTTKSEVAGVVTQQQIETLPINSRQYLSLALLMPGTTIDATRSFFATVNVGGSMTFNGTGNIVDGTINNWAEDGEPRQDVPEDAVEEFKVSNALLQGRVRPGHRRRRPGGHQVRRQYAARQRLRVLPRQVAERARRVRDREAGLPAAISSVAASAVR